MSGTILRPGLALLLTAGLGFLAATEILSGTSLLGYNVLVCLGATVAAAAVLAIEARRALRGSGIRAALPLAEAQAARLATFGALWIAYVVLLPSLGFIVATILALIASAWILAGRPTVVQIVGLSAFVLVFSGLVSAILFVPVPKGPTDIAVEELIFSLRQG